MSLVSVIIPYYRKKHYILRTLKSVIKQTYKNLEIIIIYDDPKKKDLKLIKKMVSMDKRIKLLVNRNNIGAGKSRNRGIKNSKGDYIAFIDADDIWLKNKTKLQLSLMKKRKLDFTHTNYSIINQKNKKLSKRIARDFKEVNDLIKSCDIGLSTVMIRRDILSASSFPGLKTKEDFVLWLRLLSKNIKFYGINKNLVYWSKNLDSLSSSTFQKLLDGYRVYNSYMKYNFLKSFYYLLCLSFNYLKK